MVPAAPATGTATATAAPRRRPPRRMARHLLAEFTMPLLGSISAFVLLSLLMAVFDRLSDFGGSGIPAGKLVLYFVACIPETLVVVFPVSALLAVCWTTITLGKSSELTAIRSAGVSLLWAAAYIWAVALALCVCAAVLSEVVQPGAAQVAEEIESQYIHTSAAKARARRLLSYFSRRHRRDWFFTCFNVNGASDGVVVRNLDSQGRTLSVVTAEAAIRLPGNEGWRFSQGEVTTYRYIDGADGESTPIQSPPEFFKERIFDFQERPRDIQLQSRDAEQLPLSGLIQMRRERRDLSRRVRSLVSTLIAYRLVAPLASLIAILLGFALTITTGRKGAVQGLVLAVALYVAYYAVAQLFLVAGKDDGCNPWLAGTAPTLAALAGSLALAWRKQ